MDKMTVEFIGCPHSLNLKQGTLVNIGFVIDAEEVSIIIKQFEKTFGVKVQSQMVIADGYLFLEHLKKPGLF